MLIEFLDDQGGATAVEYGLLAGILAVAVITGLTLIGTTLDTSFASVATEVGNAQPGGS